MPEFVYVYAPRMTRMGMMSRFEASRITADTYRFNRNRRRFSLAKGSFETARGLIPANRIGEDEGLLDDSDASFAEVVTLAENQGRLTRYAEGELGFMLTSDAIERAYEIAQTQGSEIDFAEFEPEEQVEMLDDEFGPFAFSRSYQEAMNPPERDPSQPRPPIGRGPLDELRDAAEVFLYDIGDSPRWDALNAGDYVLVDYDGIGGYLPVDVVNLVLDEGFNVDAGVIDPERREELRERQFARMLDFENMNRELVAEGRPIMYYPETVGQVVTR